MSGEHSKGSFVTESIKLLLEGNKEWVNSIKKEDPSFFDQLAEGRSPEYFWIGCSESRAPATEITNSIPGSIFVQRNIANLVVHTDSNLLSVVCFAVHYLKIKHLIVAVIMDVVGSELGGIASIEQRLDRLTELNVMSRF